MFRLFVTDIDGTIFGPRQPISRETKKAVALLRSHGFGVTAATGRNQWEAQRLVTDLGIELPVILANGAQIFDFAAGRLLYGKSFCIQTLTEFLGGIDAKGQVQIRWLDGEQWQECSLEDFAQAGGSGEVQRVFLVDVEHTLRLADSPACPYWLFQEGDLVELTPKDVNKGEGLLVLCSLLGIATEQVVALGNDLNDVELIQLAGVGLAVAGGHPALLQAADGIVAALEDHPVQTIAEWMMGSTPWERIVMKK